ncbi:type II secretion system protein [Enterococcus bulliens]
MSKKQSGFTLIEVCVSLFLILLCLVIPIHSMQQAKQEVEAYRFLTELKNQSSFITKKRY